MKTLIAAACLGLSLSGAALAEEDAPSLSVTLPMPPGASVLSDNYSCDGGTPFSVRYVNAGVNSLAIMPIDGETYVFVAVLAASGVHYVSGPYSWWTKGQSASFSNEMSEAEASECVVVN